LTQLTKEGVPVLSLRFRPDAGRLWLMTDIRHLEPEFFSFIPAVPRVAVSAPDAGAEYLGQEDDDS
jgi:hypothetical protein